MRTKLLFKSLLVAAGLCVGQSAWAEVTVLYERGTSTAWSASDISATGNYVWGGYAEITTKGYPYVSGNGGRTSSMTIVPTSNVILTIDAVWNIGGDGSNSTNYTYFRIGNNLEFQAHTTNQTGNVVINGTSYVITNACKKDVNRTDDEWTIHAVINTLTKQVTTLTLVGKDGGDKKATYTLESPASLGESATFTTLTFGTYREKYSPYCGLVSLVVSQETQEVTTADYTINYVYNAEIKKTVTGSNAVGETINAETPITIEGQKYYAKDDATTSLTLVDGTNTLNVELREAKAYTYNVTNSLGSTISSGTYIEGESAINVCWPKYVESDGKIYETSSPYGVSLVDLNENYSKVVPYTTSAINYFFECEGMSASHTPYSILSNDPSASNGSAVTIYSGDNYINTNSTVAAGIYNINIGGVSWASTAGTYKIDYSTDKSVWTNLASVTFEALSAGVSSVQTANNIVIPAAAFIRIYWTGGASTPRQHMDYMSLEKVGEAGTIASSGYSSLASAYGLDFSSATGIDAAYVVKSTTTEAVTLEAVNELPANSGVILKGTAGAAYSIPVKADATFAGTNLLKAAVTATAIDANKAYILKGGKFCLVTAASTVPAGKAYLLATDVPGSARSLNFVFDEAETTGINEELRMKNEESSAAPVYNLNGQRVAQPTRGLYIVNGKKVVVK